MDKQQAQEDLKAIRKQKKPSKEFILAQSSHKKIIRKLTEVMNSNSMTVPELEQATGFSKTDVFWHINAMRKYGQAEIRGESDDGYLIYGLIEVN